MVLCGIKKQYHYCLHFNDLLTFFRKGFCTFSVVLWMSNDVHPHNRVIHWCHEIIITYTVTIPLVLYPAWKRACMVATEYNGMRTDPRRGLVKFHIDDWREIKWVATRFATDSEASRLVHNYLYHKNHVMKWSIYSTRWSWCSRPKECAPRLPNHHNPPATDTM